MVKSGQSIEAELHIPLKWVIVSLFVIGMVLIIVADARSGATERLKIMFFGLLFYAAAGVAWSLHRQQSWQGRAMAIIALVLLFNLGFGWLGVSGFLMLMPIPIILAAALFSLPVATVTTIGGSLLLLWSHKYTGADVSMVEIVMTVVAMWGTLGLMFAIYRPMLDITRWSWQHFVQAQSLLEEARDRQAELEQTQDDLAVANRELTLLSERLVAMRLIAEEAQNAKAAFVAKISHEFRAPLNMIIGLIDTLTETPQVYGQDLPPVLLEDLEIVRRNSEHLTSMINDVLALSQAEAGQLTLHREWVDLRPDIHNAATVVSPLVGKKNISLEVSIPDDLPQLYCDRTRIRQVILNLVSNAARHTNQGAITVSAVMEGQYIIVSVTDTGPGVAPQDVERIFEPFHQGTGGFWREQGGSGLGLSISKQFIEHHDGRIWVESELGVGSTFAFKLPISPSSSPVAGPERWVNADWVFLERAAWPKVPRLPHKQRIILCDETGILYPSFTRYADDIEFVDIRSLSETIEELQHCPAHAVILNTTSIHQSEALIKQVRLEAPDTPVIGCSLPKPRDRAFEAGVLDYLIKPVTQADLKKALDTIDVSPKHVLVADDHLDAQQLFTRMLLICNDRLEITTASSGEETLNKLRSNPPDLVLLDIMMPDMDGWQVMEYKQQDEVLRDIPVIFVSAEDPVQQAANSEFLMATTGQGISINQLLRCSLHFSQLLLEPYREPDPGLE